METFTGWQYLLIDCANQWGLDKDLFHLRIEWVETNLAQLESLEAQRLGKWKERPLFLKAVQAIRKAQQGKPTGHMIGFDACNSGMQIMSATTGCHAGALSTGLVDPTVRADAYKRCMTLMLEWVPNLPDEERESVKQAVMTVLYGSRMEPINLFGEGTPELNAFYKAMWKLAPGACELLQDTLDSWQAYALTHDWLMPDNGHVHIPVMDKVEKRIEVDELDHATFTYKYKINEGSEKGLSNAANIVHSIDAYVLRNIIRRCNYDYDQLSWAQRVIDNILIERDVEHTQPETNRESNSLFTSLKARYKASQMAEIRILDEANDRTLRNLSTTHLKRLLRTVNQCLVHAPFEVICVHDEFKCHANNMDHLRFHYKEILAELAESEILSDIFTQIYGQNVVYQKKSHTLGDVIRGSNYALS